MMNEDFLLIEEQLGVILPNYYKQLMVNYPFDDNYYNFIRDRLLNDPIKIINVNYLLRKEGFNGEKWSYNYYIFTAIDRGIAFINLDDEKTETIYFLGDEKANLNLKKIKNYAYSKNFQEYIEQLKVFQRIHDNP